MLASVYALLKIHFTNSKSVCVFFWNWSINFLFPIHSTENWWEKVALCLTTWAWATPIFPGAAGETCNTEKKSFTDNRWCSVSCELHSPSDPDGVELSRSTDLDLRSGVLLLARVVGRVLVPGVLDGLGDNLSPRLSGSSPNLSSSRRITGTPVKGNEKTSQLDECVWPISFVRFRSGSPLVECSSGLVLFANVRLTESGIFGRCTSEKNF